MKRTLFFMLLASLAVFSVTVSAQDNGGQRLTREQMAEAQAKHIADELALDDETSGRFVDTYCSFQQEIWALGPRPGHQRHHPMTDEEVEQSMKARFDHSQKILDLRKKYYAIYSEFLTQKQIQKMYDLEKQMMGHLARHGKHGEREKHGRPGIR